MHKQKILYDYAYNMHEIINKRVLVYWNLHKNVWSIKCKNTGIVIGYSKLVYLKNCKFKVSPSGRKRVLLEKRKNVHAMVEGTICHNKPSYDLNYNGFTYNPYKYDSFVDRDSLEPIYESETATLSSSLKCPQKSKRRPLTIYGVRR